MVATWIDTGACIVPEPFYKEEMGEPVREWEGEFCGYIKAKSRPWRCIYCFWSRSPHKSGMVMWGRRVTCAEPHTKEWGKDWHFMGDSELSPGYRFYSLGAALDAAKGAYWGWNCRVDEAARPCFVRGWDERTGKA